MADVVCLGEALIDFVADVSGVDLQDAPGFRKAPGGAPANVAVGVAKLGTSAAFLGKVGDDPFGKFLARTFADAGVDTTKVVYDDSAKTGLAFVSLMADGDRDFTFYRNPSADMLLTPDELPTDLLATCKVFHYGSITLIQEPSRSATLKAIEAAKQTGAIISYDPNLRLSLWPSEEAAREGMIEGLPYADFVKVAEEELEFMFGISDVADGIEKLHDMGVALVAVTAGPRGCAISDGERTIRHAGFTVGSEDTTGAGDGFVAAVLHHLVKTGKTRPLGPIPEEELQGLTRFANAVGALTTTRKGAIPALPTPDEVRAFLEKH
jgi:sugar/nucleoside kinase (ribokinase family)